MCGEVKFKLGDVNGACNDLKKAQKLGYTVAFASFKNFCER